MISKTVHKQKIYFSLDKNLQKDMRRHVVSSIDECSKKVLNLHIEQWFFVQDQDQDQDKKKNNCDANLGRKEKVRSKSRELIFFVHGLSEHPRLHTDFFTQYLSENPHTEIWMVDLPGHGLSDQIPYGVSYFELFQEALIESINHMMKHKGVISFHLMGYSMGATVIMKTLSDAFNFIKGQVLSTILVNPFLKSKLNIPWFVKKAFVYSFPLLRDHFNDHIEKISLPNTVMGDDITHSKKHADLFDEDPLVKRTIALEFLYELLCIQNDVARYPYYLDMPVLILLSANDSVVNTEATLKIMQGISSFYLDIKIFSNMKHSLLNEVQRKEVCKAINIFMSEIEVKFSEKKEVA